MTDLPSDSEKITVTLVGEPEFPLTPGFYNRAYAQFSNQIDTSQLITTLSEQATYSINPKMGKVIEAKLFRSEVANSNLLYLKMSYNFMSEDVFKNTLTPNEEPKNTEKSKEISFVEERKIVKEAPVEIYKVVDGKELTYEEWKMYEERQWQIHQEKKKKKGFFGF